MGDKDYAKELDALLNAGAKAMEEHLWARDHYLLYNEPETGKKLDVVFTPTLDGQCFTYLHGIPGVFPRERVEKTLAAIRRACSISKLGIPPTYAGPAGEPWSDRAGYLTGQYNYCPFAVVFIAMTYMYEGHKDFGMDILRRVLEIEFVKYGYAWEGIQVNSGSADDSRASYGTDYYMKLNLWAVPAAMDGKNMSAPCKPGGLVNRVILAGREGL
jgi:uncharacterized protein (DUF608 family)